MAKFIVIQNRQVSKELHCFGDCFVKQRAVCIINVRTVRTARTELTVKLLNSSKNIRAEQGNILSVDNDMQFTDRKLCLTDRQNLYGPYKLYGPYDQ